VSGASGGWSTVRSTRSCRVFTSPRCFLGAILQQALGAAKCVVHGGLGVGEMIVALRRMIDVDVDATRQGEMMRH